MVENIFRHIAHHTPGVMADPRSRLSDKLHRVLTGAVEVDKAIFFSVIITIAAFLPLFTMQGVEGQIFGPMARTYAQWWLVWLLHPTWCCGERKRGIVARARGTLE